MLFIRHPSRTSSFGRPISTALAKNPRVRLLPRLEYLPFLRRWCAEFVISDGGGNQEELSYLGKPTLIMRNEIERPEGLGANTVLSRLDDRVSSDSVADYERYRSPRLRRETSPTL